MEAAAAAAPTPPINVIYSHLHDSIRAELDALAAAVVALQQKGAAGGGAAGGGGDGGGGAAAGAASGLRAELEALQERYSFLEQVYTYHSSVEDEVGCDGGGGGWAGRRPSRATAAQGRAA